MRIKPDPRRFTAMVFDGASLALAWLFCFALAWGMRVPADAVPAMLTGLIVVVPVCFMTFSAFGLYRGIWRYASLHDLKQIGLTVLLGTLISTAVLFVWSRADLIPRATFVMHPIVVLFLMFGGRIAYRWWKEQRSWSKHALEGKPVLILGADDASFRLISELEHVPAWQVVGVLDDAPKNIGRRVLGHRITGRWQDLPRMVASTGARHALLAVKHADQKTRRRAFDICEAAGVKLLIVPQLDDVISERVRFSSIRNVDVDDLLGRDSVQLDTGGLRQLISDKPILITGAGGSIGSELCTQVARFRPAEIVLFEQSEFALYEVSEKLIKSHPDVKIHTIVGDIKDKRALSAVFDRFAPAVVFHAAAYKHVPLMETTNAWQAVRNNALGTVCLVETASRYPIEKIVFISSDKAVNPTSVMGATKRLAEMLLQRWAERHPDVETVIVRFGNVLGSTGSVVPKFRRQIEQGGPITITHPEIKRYFMSVGEATQLVMQAALVGDSGDILVLEMGEPVKIIDLAHDLIRLSGLPEDGIPIHITGLRPGEKLYEELLADDESTIPTRHPKVRVARPGPLPGASWEQQVREWLAGTDLVSDDDVRVALTRFVPEYTPFQVPNNVVPLRRADPVRASA
ncbi:MAG: polysaccharide biosynthesis protein [Burkholderiaceae bacterium]